MFDITRDGLISSRGAQHLKPNESSGYTTHENHAAYSIALI